MKNKIQILLTSEGDFTSSDYREALEDILSECSDRIEVNYIASVLSGISKKFEFVVKSSHEGHGITEQVILLKKKKTYGNTLESAEREAGH